MATTKKKRRVGRPTKYKKAYCEAIIEYFSRPITKTVVDVIEGKNWSKTVEREVLIGFPTIEGFAANELEIDPDTVVNWSKVHPEFFGAYTRAKAIQKNLLIENALAQRVDTRFAQFLAMNAMGMSNKTETKAETEVTHKFEEMDDDQLDAAIKAREARLRASA